MIEIFNDGFLDKGILVKAWVKDTRDIYDHRKLFSEIKTLSRLPYATKHIALMADVHASGMNVPIGTVLATKDIVAPELVSDDSGCGVAYSQFNYEVDDNLLSVLEELIENIVDKIPLGFNHRDPQKANENFNFKIPYYTLRDKYCIEDDIGGIYYTEPDEMGKLFAQYWENIATLGGGNHFIEIQATEDNKLAVMIHSGSRGIGSTVAKYYRNKAKELNDAWYITSLVDDLKINYLPVNSKIGQEYLHWMNFALDFAEYNRRLMMEIVIQELLKVLPDNQISEQRELNVHHNYVEIENVEGVNYWVHRKGAVRARKSDVVPIPGAMGSYSYIAQGKGNDDSFHSCSHGAGRTHSRTAAKEEFSRQEMLADFKEKGIIYGSADTEGHDEYYKAYKDIDEVMVNQKDLVEPLEKLHTLAVIKG